MRQLILQGLIHFVVLNEAGLGQRREVRRTLEVRALVAVGLVIGIDKDIIGLDTYLLREQSDPGLLEPGLTGFLASMGRAVG